MDSYVVTAGPNAGPIPHRVNMLAVLFTICCLTTRTLGRTCDPVTCSPGFEIKSCDQDGGRDRCEACSRSKVQPLNISSIDSDDHHCFGVPAIGNCKKEGVINSRWRDDWPNCSKPCECDVANCYAGKTACDCRKYEPCEVNYQMNSMTGVCEPCPPNKEKRERGCYPCQHVYMNSTHTQGPHSDPPQRITSSISAFQGINQTRSRGTQDTTSDRPQATTDPTSDHTAMAKELVDPGDSLCINAIIAIILGVVLLLVFMLVAALVVRRYRHRRHCRTSHLNNDHQENKTNSFTIIQENSLLLNIKDNNANVACELEVEAAYKDSGYLTHCRGSKTSCSSSLVTQPKSSNPSQNGASSFLITCTSSPTEHDEESTHVKTIS